MSKRTDNFNTINRRNKNKSFIERFIFSQRFLAVLLLVVLIAISFPLMRSFGQRKKIEREIEIMRQENENYRNKSDDLREMIDYLQSEASLEEQARLNLGLKKPNEEVFVVSRQEEKTSLSVYEENNIQLSNLQLWLNYFFK